MSRVTSSLGRARNSSQVQRRGSSTSPTTEKSHWSSGVCGVGPAERTGKSGVTYWPGGTRSPGTSSRRRPLKAREMIGGISPPYRWEQTPAAPVPGDDRLCSLLAREWASATSCLRICVGAGDPQAGGLARRLLRFRHVSYSSRRSRCRTHRHGRRSAASHRGGRLVDDKTELRRVGIGVIARHVEVLSSRRLKADE